MRVKRQHTGFSKVLQNVLAQKPTFSWPGVAHFRIKYCESRIRELFVAEMAAIKRHCAGNDVEPISSSPLDIAFRETRSKLIQNVFERPSDRQQTDELFLGSLFDYLTERLSKILGLSSHLYQDNLYSVSGSGTDDEKRLLVLEFVDNDRRKFERLKAKFSSIQSEEIRHERIRIPEDVRIFVWRRDQGKCVQCGNRENLEYDHIVPVSRGGSNTARNVELLCQGCNRSKGDRIQ